MKTNPEKEWFGEERVTPTEKTKLVRGVFDNVAQRYDLMNDLMSGGLHRLWKDRFVRQIRARAHHKYLDVAGGTGDIAFRLYRAAQKRPDITVFDLNENMLRVGRDRSINKGWLNAFHWTTGNAESLPFESSSFDVYTIAFGLRNVTHIDTALREAARVLKPGGRFFCLEFSHMEEPALQKLYDLYSYNIIPKIGKAIVKDEESYQYLIESIRKFPKQEVLKDRLLKAGFDQSSYSNLSSGVVAIHQGLIL